MDVTREYRRPHAAPRPPPRQRRAHRPNFRRALTVVLLALLAVVLVAVVLIWPRLAAFNDRVSSAGAASTALAGGLIMGSDPINVLIIGYGGPEHAGAYLADSINLVSIDPATDTTTIIPIPRDLWIEGHHAIPDNGKINQAFALGVAAGGIETGGERTREVISHVTGLDVQHWIALDFTGFEAMVDAVDGVTVENPTAFRYGGPDAAATGNWDGSFAAGELNLSGEEALYYARTRYTDTPAESSDFARSVRQQRILGALRQEITGGVVGAVPNGLAVMDAAGEHLDTNMSVIDLGLFALNMDTDRRIELTEDEALEAVTASDGQYALVVVGRSSPSDYDPLRAYIARRLAESAPEPTTSPSP